VPTQQVWLAGLSSSSSGSGSNLYGVRGPPLLVHVPESSVGAWWLGAPVHLVGHASLCVTPCRAGGCGSALRARAEVVACSMRPTMLQPLLWSRLALQLPPPAAAATAAAGRGPAAATTAAAAPICSSVDGSGRLHELWEHLGVTLGLLTHDALDPHVALALLLSSAAVLGGGAEHRVPTGVPGQQQISLLLLHDSMDPSTQRLLRQAAALLSPQSLAIPLLHAEHITPVPGVPGRSVDAVDSAGGMQGPDTGHAALFASVLQLANAGKGRLEELAGVGWWW
jgi:hypothetical protein